MFKFLLKFFLVFCFFVNYCVAEILKKVDISGNQRISNETILALGKIKINENLKEEDINIFLKNIYQTNFFI